MRIACIQQTARDVRSYRKAWTDILSLIDEAAEKEADLVVLPECAYPAYYLGYDMNKTAEAMEYIDAVAGDISDKAREHNTYIAIGMAVKKGSGMINGGMLFNRNGELVTSCGKSNLWHFDRKWFNCGMTYDTADTDFGKVGMIVCADGRMPEISRILALKGAELIIDMANLTAAGSDPSKLTNPQFEYMLSTRALENGVWLVLADKVGVEANSILYAGRSCIINPEGEIAVSASSDKQQVIYADVDLKAPRKRLPARKPEAYKLLVQPTEKLPIYKDMDQPVVIRDTEVQTAVIQFEYTSEDEFAEKTVKFIKALEDQDCALIMLPQLKREINMLSCTEKVISAIACPNTIFALTGYRMEAGFEFKSTVVASRDKVFGVYDKVHIDEEGLTSGSGENAVIKTPLCSIGVMHDKEGMLPEVARCLMLGGADVVLWSDNSASAKADIITRTRASENKVYTVRASSMDIGDCSTITGPDGRIIASTLSGADQSISALVVTALSKSKTVVPGTNVVLDRKPFLYELLVK